MTNDEVKRKAELMACDIVEFLRNNLKDDEERKHRYLEMACSFLTLACDPTKEMFEIEKEIRAYCKDIYKISLTGMARYKSGNTSRVVKEFD